MFTRGLTPSIREQTQGFFLEQVISVPLPYTAAASVASSSVAQGDSLSSWLLVKILWKYPETAFIDFYKHNNNLSVQRMACACHTNSPSCFLTELSLCEICCIVFSNMLPHRENLSSEVKRIPYSALLSVYELLEVPKGAGGEALEFLFSLGERNCSGK